VDETAATVLPPDTGAQAPAETGHSGRARDGAVRVRPGLRAPGRGSSRRAGARKALGAHDGGPAAESRRSIPRIGRCTRLRPRREPGVRRVVVHAPAVERAGITHRRAASRTGRPGPPERPRAPASPSVRAPDRRAPAGRRVPAAAAPGTGAVLGATAQRARTPRACARPAPLPRHGRAAQALRREVAAAPPLTSGGACGRSVAVVLRLVRAGDVDVDVLRLL